MVVEPDNDAPVTANRADEAGEEQGNPVPAEAAEGDVSLQDQLDGERRAKEQLHQQYLRLLADFDNYRRRSRAELASAGQQAQEEMALMLLPVLDNFDRALAAGGESCDSLRTGMNMICRQLVDTLRQAGLEPIEATGMPFNPEFHEAVASSGDVGDQPVVLQELRRGYTFKGRVIRPSMVEVGASEGISAVMQGVEGEKE